MKLHKVQQLVEVRKMFSVSISRNKFCPTHFCTFQADLEADPLVFEGYDKPVEVRLTNNDHTLRLESNQTIAMISGGGLEGFYRFSQINFHWGESSNVGSEHQINGEIFPMEVQLIHYNTR